MPSPVMATSLPLACSRLISAILSSGFASARKSSTPAWRAIAAAVSGLSPVIIIGANAHRAQMIEALAAFRLLRCLSARSRRARVRFRRRAAAFRRLCDVVDGFLAPGSGILLPPFGDVFRDGVGRAFANLRAVEIDAGHAGLGGEGNERRHSDAEFAAAESVFLFDEHDDRSTFGSFVGERGELRGIGEFGFGDARAGMKHRGLAIAERDGSGLVEQQNIHVAGGFNRAAGHGDNVALNHAIHAGDADRGEQSANRRRNQAHEKRDQYEDRLRRAGINGERLQCHDGE